jgi:hypothetical protein
MYEARVAEYDLPRVDLDTLDAMASLARETGLVVHLVLPRHARVLERARALAENGLNIKADVLAHTISIRFEA